MNNNIILWSILFIKKRELYINWLNKKKYIK